MKHIQLSTVKFHRQWLLYSSRLCVDLLDLSPWFKPQFRHFQQNKYIFCNLLSSHFWTKTLRVKKIVVNNLSFDVDIKL